MTERDHEVVENIRSRVKINSKLTSLIELIQIEGIMVNMGRIHKELGKFLMISSNLIKSDHESLIKLGKMVFNERGLEDQSTKSKINEFDFDFAEKLKIEER